MKNTFALIFLTIVCFSCVQKDHVKIHQTSIDSAKAHKKYIQQATAFIQVVNQNKPIALSDHVDSADFLNCIEQLKWDTLTFTKSELANIIKQSENQPIKKWTNEIVPLAKLINGDTIKHLFNDYNKGWKSFYRKFGRNLTTFSAPIFLRNNQYCIFYRAFHCGDRCGEGELTLYKREGDTWKKVKTYCNWVSLKLFT